MESGRLKKTETRRQKVVFVNRFFYPDDSATSQMLTDLTRCAAQAGHHVTVVTGRFKLRPGGDALPPREVLEGISVERVWGISQGNGSIARKLVSFLSFYPMAFLKLISVLRRGDVLVAKTDPPLIGFVGLIAAGLRRAKLVNWLQDVYPEVAFQINGGRWMPVSALKAIRNLALKRAWSNVVIGHGMLAEIERQGVRSDKIRVIQNWCDDEAVRPKPSSDSRLRQQWGIADTKFVLGYSGNLGRAHEAQTVAEAATRLRYRSDILFLLVGGGVENARLQILVSDRQLPNFLFKPYQQRDDVADSLAAADAHWMSLKPELEGLIVPSKFYGVAAAGRPSIAVMAETGEIAAALQDYGCGLVVAPGDVDGLVQAICLLAEDPSLRVRMGDRARAMIDEGFSKAFALDNWLQVIARAKAASIERSSPRAKTAEDRSDRSSHNQQVEP